MKKLFFNTLGAALAMLTLNACTNEAENLAPEETLREESNLCTFTIPEVTLHGVDASSRTAISIADNKLKFVWAENDRIGILPDEGAQVYFTIDDEKEGGTQASFDGGAWALKPNHQYDAYFPFVEDIMLERTAVPVDFTGQRQKGNNNMEHLGSRDYMAAKGTTNDNGGVNYQFAHLASIVILKLNVPDADTQLKCVTFTAPEETAFTTQGTIDLTAETLAITSSVTSPSLTIELEDITTTGDNEEVTVYFMCAPMNLADKTLEVTLTIADPNGASADATTELKYTTTGWNMVAGDGYIYLQDNIDATEMTPEDLQSAITEKLGKGKTDIDVKLAEDADATMFTAIAAALAATIDPSLNRWELNTPGTIDLTISGAKTIPELTFCVDEYQNENWRAGVALRSVTLTDATTIGDSAFFGCTMTSFSAPKAIAIEGYYTLCACMNLTDVYLPSVQALGNAVFSECYALKTISLPECVDLGGATFVWCESLETVYAPKATKLGSLVFNLCTSLTKVTLGSVESVNQYYESIDNGLFSEANDTRNIELVLSSEQKAMTFDSSTKYWKATETDYNGSVDHNNKSFIGYTFKSVTLQ